MKSYLYICIFLAGLCLVADGCNRKRSSTKCSDGIQNQNETAVDCGGICSPCRSCTDGIENQDETGIDCGGSCKPCSILYAGSGLYGTNVLGDANIYADRTCSASIEISAGSNVKIVIKNTSDDNSGWTYRAGSVRGWAIDAYNQASKSQQLLAIGPISCDAEFTFTGKGSADIEIYENGVVTPTFNRTISWE